MRSTQEIQDIFTNWQYLYEGLQYSPGDYYEALESRIESKEIKGVKTKRVALKEKGMLSQKRIYLRVTYGELTFDICGAPFGKNAFFFSYWMGARHSHGCLGIFIPLLLSIPIIGEAVESNMNPLTYYQRDTAAMFNTTISSLVLEEIDQIIGEAELEPIPEDHKVANDKKLTQI